MSATIHRRVPKERLAVLVPSALKLLAASIPVEKPYALAVFTRRPVRVGQVKRTIEKLGPLSDERLVVAGIDFTEEALSFASDHGAYVLAQHRFGWTESTYDETHTAIATNKKRPLPR